jgi:hypothetical protein
MSRTALILKHAQLPLLPEGGEVVDVSLRMDGRNATEPRRMRGAHALPPCCPARQTSRTLSGVIELCEGCRL